MVVEGIGGPPAPVPERPEMRRAGVPVGNSIGGGVLDVEIASGLGGGAAPALDGGAAAPGGELLLGKGCEKLQFLGIVAHDPGQAARPGREGREALLRTRTTVTAVVEIEDAFVGHAAAHVVSVAALAVVDVIACGGGRVPEEAFEQRHALVMFLQEDMAEEMPQGEGSEGTNRVGEERVRAVERVDEPSAVGQARPAAGLDRGRALEGRFVAGAFPGLGRQRPLEHHA